MELDDVVIAKQVMATHHLNANINIELDADFVINLAENIFNPNMVSREVEQEMLITEKSIQEFREVEKDMPMLQTLIQKELSYQIKQLSFEVAFKSLNNDTDCHLATICLLSILSTYPWEAKVVMMLAAFSLICGDFIIISRYSHWKKLPNKLRLFKQNLIVAPSEKISEDSIVKLIINLVKCVSELHQPSFFSPPQPVILATY
ncbi:PREDICTED: protein SIEVE ELEMENT OCCLUSION B-like [Ipomoea nil]|uniref:protein SIEVE ELEMENT OCCLUSION B-like n=1 Tax=Ipomoea nil TaxID=35883 RepID=UPI00090162C4|nr:PREDICTED: protein SIEVE ELEMENT OCCLUSION B-like [Ipomoea nil]